MVPFGVLPGQPVAGDGDQRAEAARRRLIADGSGHELRDRPIPTATPASRSARSAPSSTRSCSIITSIPGSATALDDAIDAAAKAGIPFVTAAGSVTSPNAINVDSNYARWGYDMITAHRQRAAGRRQRADGRRHRRPPDRGAGARRRATRRWRELPSSRSPATSTATGRPMSPRRWCCRRSPPTRRRSTRCGRPAARAGSSPRPSPRPAGRHR